MQITRIIHRFTFYYIPAAASRYQHDTLKHKSYSTFKKNKKTSPLELSHSQNNP